MMKSTAGAPKLLTTFPGERFADPIQFADSNKDGWVSPRIHLDATSRLPMPMRQEER
jgi:hypothetical protein